MTLVEREEVGAKTRDEWIAATVGSSVHSRKQVAWDKALDMAIQGYPYLIRSSDKTLSFAPIHYTFSPISGNTIDFPRRQKSVEQALSVFQTVRVFALSLCKDYYDCLALSGSMPHFVFISQTSHTSTYSEATLLQQLGLQKPFSTMLVLEIFLRTLPKSMARPLQSLDAKGQCLCFAYPLQTDQAFRPSEMRPSCSLGVSVSQYNFSLWQTVFRQARSLECWCAFQHAS